MFCPKCRRSLPPPAILRLGGCLFGHGFQAWAVYQRVVLRLSYRLITATMEDMFCERTSEATVINFVRNLANFYGRCEKANLDRLLAVSVPPRRRDPVEHPGDRPLCLDPHGRPPCCLPDDCDP